MLLFFVKSEWIGSIFFLARVPNLLNLHVSSKGSGQLLKSFPANFLKLLSFQRPVHNFVLNEYIRYFV